MSKEGKEDGQKPSPNWRIRIAGSVAAAAAISGILFTPAVRIIPNRSSGPQSTDTTPPKGPVLPEPPAHPPAPPEEPKLLEAQPTADPSSKIPVSVPVSEEKPAESTQDEKISVVRNKNILVLTIPYETAKKIKAQDVNVLTADKAEELANLKKQRMVASFLPITTGISSSIKKQKPSK